MQIQHISIRRSHTPLKHPFTTALRSVESIDEILLILSTDRGLEGYGSAPATLAVTGDDLERIETDLQRAKEAFTDTLIEDYEITFENLHALRLCKSAQAAFDIALHDLFAKETGLPLYEYLGGSVRRFETLYTISVDTPEMMVKQAVEVFNEGYTHLKVKLDGNLVLDIERTKQLHYALPQAKLYLDINQAFSLGECETFLAAVEAIPIVLLEQPLQMDQREEMALLTRQNRIPILADESLFDYEDAQWLIEHKGADYFNIKLMKTGGIYEAKKILDLARIHHIPCMMGSMLETALSVTAALHLACAYENVRFTDLDGPTLARESIGTGGITYDGAAISLSQGTGLGITPKESE